MWTCEANVCSNLAVQLVKVHGGSVLDFTVLCDGAMEFGLHWIESGHLCGGKQHGCALCKCRAVRPMAYLASRREHMVQLIEIGASTLAQIKLFADEKNGGRLRGLQIRFARSERTRVLLPTFMGVAKVRPQSTVDELTTLRAVARLYGLPDSEPLEDAASYSLRLQARVLQLAHTQAEILHARHSNGTR